MLKIKLARFGKRHQPHFRIVVIEQREKRDGAYTDLIGHYAPTAQPKMLDLDLVAYDKWLSQGAQPTDTVAALARRLRPESKVKPTAPTKKVAETKSVTQTKPVTKKKTTVQPEVAKSK